MRHHVITRSKTTIIKQTYVAPIPTISEPTSVVEALDNSDWKAAMQGEYDALIRNKTWTLTPLPAGNNLISCKWFFNIK